ncbi:caspase family protein [Bradyrhizobium sp. AUGA SZCCT0169]|uniref:caspase family protein n=1 Tax=Bradyrhizobium sp. AUGA SZCCT0169 TaxID=2807663 RepID=UPI001BA930F5|nr:caspase family protein [Bradyrhizobium sp. AUGA SZCCT0169]MBR1247514.1 caspase family protein [Bradyrhizobium sp. AUGA SZCCT0169]
MIALRQIAHRRVLLPARGMTFLLAFLLSLPTLNAIAAPSERSTLWEACRNKDGEAALGACLAIINTRGIPMGERAAAHYTRCYHYILRHDYRNALASCDRSLEDNPSLVDAWLNRSTIRSGFGQFDLAIKDATRALALANTNSDRAGALRNRAAAFVRRGKIAESQADLDQAARLQSGDVYNFINRADFLLQVGRPDEALHQIARARATRVTTTFSQQKMHADIGLLNGKALVELKRYAEALPVLAALLRIDANNAEAHALKSVALARTNNVGAARDALATARRLPLSSPDAAGVFREAEQLVRELDSAMAPRLENSAEPARERSNRVALIIGNTTYQNVAPLTNAGRDAEALAAEFDALGFRKVTLLRDLSRAQMFAALRAFAADAETADWAVIYFAGHGLEMGGVNWLAPVDAQFKTDRDVRLEAVSIDELSAAIEGVRGLRLIVLDACRNNPFAPQMRFTNSTRSLGAGLARVEPEGGTMIAYAAKAGQVAHDGDDGNSPFMKALLKRLKQPGLEISMLFRFVRDDVMAATGRQQEPFVYGSLPSEPFYFRSAATANR